MFSIFRLDLSTPKPNELNFECWCVGLRLCEVLLYCEKSICLCRRFVVLWVRAAVFKLGSADQGGSTTGSQGSVKGFRKVVIVCTVFNNLRPTCFQICTQISFVSFLDEHVFWISAVVQQGSEHFVTICDNIFLWNSIFRTHKYEDEVLIQTCR